MPSNTYIMDDPESGPELHRLIDQHRVLTEVFGGLVPEDILRERISAFHDILDIACGPGGWVLDMAQTHPHTRITGFDISPRMVKYAQMQAEVRGLSNASFLVMDATKPLGFAEDSFDLINGRLLTSFLFKETWPNLLAECRRILRPGGFFRLTEVEVAVTNSPSLEALMRLLTRSFWVTGRTFSVDGSTIGITPMMSPLLRAVGFRIAKQAAYAVDFGSGMPAHEAFFHEMEGLFRAMKPFITRMSISEAEYDQLLDQALAEMGLPSFAGMMTNHTTVGENPR